MRRAKPGQTGARGLRNRVSDVPLFSVEEEEEEEEGSGTLLASVFWAATTLEGSDGSAFWARTCGYTPSATLQRTNYLSVVTPPPSLECGVGFIRPPASHSAHYAPYPWALGFVCT